MITSLRHSFAGLVTSLSVPLLAALPLAAEGVPKIADRPTHAELQARQVKQKQQLEEQRARPEGNDSAVQAPRNRKPEDLVSRSSVLSFGNVWTIVPRGAVLHTPQFLRGRVDSGRQGRFVAWKEFYAKNRGWIHLQNVKMVQARGEEAMPEGAAEAYRNIGRVVVAVCHGGPISIRPSRAGDAPAVDPESGGVVPISTP